MDGQVSGRHEQAASTGVLQQQLAAAVAGTQAVDRSNDEFQKNVGSYTWYLGTDKIIFKF